MAFWTLLAVACYGLTLFVLVEDLFLLAVPGILGIAGFGSMGGSTVLHWPLRNRMQGTGEPNTAGLVAHYRAVPVKRLLLVLAVAATT